MTLPFTHDQFLEVFAAFNRTWWPALAALWIATAWMAWRWWSQRRVAGSAVLGLLAVHWLWSGVAYHALAFRAINPVAGLFAAAFVAQGLAFAVAARRAPAMTRRAPGPRRALADALLLYGLAYPAIGMTTGLSYPAMPVFGVPCPTTLVTAGWLCGATGVGRALAIVPVAWGVVGSSAAIVLGIRADAALIVAALAMLAGLRRSRPAVAA